MKIARLNSKQSDFADRFDDLLHWEMGSDDGVEGVVRDVLRNIRLNGDEAVLEYTKRFDSVAAAKVGDLFISSGELEEAYARIAADDRHALQRAALRIREYHEHQIESSWSYTDSLGNKLGQKITPLSRVGVYVPGGKASYPSSVLMTLIPARVAGVEELVVTVPTPQGERNDMVLAALFEAGVNQVIAIGGAQAIGALAYGTQSIACVDKVVGPGNAYVAAAKRQVFGHVGIDVIAGPSEVLVIADGTTDPEWAALDLFSQAEHDAAAQSILISPDKAFLDAVEAQMQALLPTMQRQDTIAASLAARGALIQSADIAEAIALGNRIAPEHLELHVANPDAWLDQVKHAGAIFCGAHTAETFGDYVAGPSHVLPTFGTARFASPLGVYDFVKRSSVIALSAEGAAGLADIAVPLASSEGLQAHARAAAVRATALNEVEK